MPLSRVRTSVRSSSMVTWGAPSRNVSTISCRCAVDCKPLVAMTTADVPSVELRWRLLAGGHPRRSCSRYLGRRTTPSSGLYTLQRSAHFSPTGSAVPTLPVSSSPRGQEPPPTPLVPLRLATTRARCSLVARSNQAVRAYSPSARLPEPPPERAQRRKPASPTRPLLERPSTALREA